MAQLPPGFVVVRPSGPTPPVAPQNLPPTPSSGPMATPQVAPQATSKVPQGFQPVPQEVPTREQDRDYLERVGDIITSREERMERAYENFQQDKIAL